MAAAAGDQYRHVHASDLLVGRELVVAECGESNRRLVRLRVTAAGIRVLRRAPGAVTGILPDALSSLDNKTLARLESDLGRLIEALQVDDKGGKIPLGQP